MTGFLVQTRNLKTGNVLDIYDPTSWSYRSDAVANDIAADHPDLIGFQEMTAPAIDWIAKYNAYLAWLHGFVVGKGTLTPLAWNNDQFDLLEQRKFYLSPDNTKRKAWNADSERAASLVLLQDKGTKRRLIFGNTHLDNESEQARVEGTKLILSRLASLNGGDKSIPVVITGDFNCGPYRTDPSLPDKSEPYGIFARVGFMDAYRCVNGKWPPPNTFHDFKEDRYVPDKFGTWYVDWILVRGLDVKYATIDTEPDHDRPLSDHYGVTAKLAFAD